MDDNILRTFCFTCGGYLAPIAAALGGWVSQEVIKALTAKFTPVQQWLTMDFIEIVPKQDSLAIDFQPRQDRWDAIRHVVGQPVCEV